MIEETIEKEIREKKTEVSFEETLQDVIENPPIDDENITRFFLEEKEIILIGTAHVSKKSAEQVKEVIDYEKPDAVCVELDQQRYQSILAGNKWKETDIFKIIKEKKSTLLLVNLMISSFQKRMAKQFGVKPGQEMIQGIESAKENGAKLVLADRNIQVTFSRVWRGLGIKGKAQLMLQIFFSLFEGEDITEEELEKLKSKDMLNAMLKEFTEAFPRLKTPLIDERDQYLAQKIKTAPGEKIIAVLGAAHVPGIKEQIHYEHDLKALSRVPKKKKSASIIPWLIPAIIVGVIGYTFYLNIDAGIQQSITWILWNGSFSALGAALAFGHPLTILSAFLAAPLSSLNPMLAAGWAAGIVEAVLRKPNVQDFEDLTEDLLSFKGFWRNKVTRILLVVALTNIGSSVGTLIGGANVIRLFLETIGM
ncbi:TraB/GumN family protein [Tindallia californiensis]|uniref:Pheromone shutdown-related protein TraB n=1 Tax=Tindallia californiensis TaxID=159292 RepID=A0A1H3MFG8_9FIRM|nr:TraB/GumN family protein [Tindallia californiensis]SDY75431.1 pheromone shutdown-related protein TraB [Tindallia californiensis]